MFFYTTHLLNLTIGLENMQKKERVVTFKNCPCEINMHFIELTS